MAEKLTTEEVKATLGEALDQFPDRCVVDKDRLCYRVSTSLARAEHRLNFGTINAETALEQTKADADAVEERCKGVAIDMGRTSCGLGGINHPYLGRKS